MTKDETPAPGPELDSVYQPGTPGAPWTKGEVMSMITLMMLVTLVVMLVMMMLVMMMVVVVVGINMMMSRWR